MHIEVNRGLCFVERTGLWILFMLTNQAKLKYMQLRIRTIFAMRRTEPCSIRYRPIDRTMCPNSEERVITNDQCLVMPWSIESFGINWVLIR